MPEIHAEVEEEKADWAGVRIQRRRVRGRLRGLSHTGHRSRKKAHNERTNRAGKLWAKAHVAKERVVLERRRRQEQKDKARRKRLQEQGVHIAGDE